MPDMISGVGAAAAAPAAADPLGGLDGQAFLRLLVAQLRYQNPMSPSDPSAMLQQTSALRQVETLNQISQSQQSLLRMQQASMASNLVGKEVSAVDTDGTPVRGTVEAVRFTDRGPALVIGGRQVPLDGTAEIGLAPISTPTPTP